MVKYRLQLIAKELMAELMSVDEASLRRVAVAVSMLALQRSGLESPVVNKALEYLNEGRLVPQRIRTDLEDLVDQLDEKYFDLKEAAEAADKGDEMWHPEFHQARAAAAVFFVCEEDPLLAASESAYEASVAAHDDPQSVKRVIGKALRPLEFRD